MVRRQLILAAVLSSCLTMLLIGGTLLLFSGALAAPGVESSYVNLAQSPPVQKNYISVSSMAFQPFSQRTLPYRRGFDEQILALDSATREADGQNNWFTAPLYLPDNVILTGLTFFGRDTDPTGWLEIALWRCTHGGDVSCINVPLSSYRTDEAFAGGSFDSGKIPLNEVVNNQLYSYTLATRIMALNGSGLRSVLVETSNSGSPLTTPVPGTPLPGRASWTLDNRNVTTQLATGLPTSAVVQICSNSNSSANVEVQYGSNLSTLTPGNCARFSGYSTYSVKNVGVYGSFASGTFEVFGN
ncbi:MAG: hypothetical protein H6632_03270 [Anaerolineales bacterium]|nr:hypothetical protein [Anaerolineales bacterium]